MVENFDYPELEPNNPLDLFEEKKIFQEEEIVSEIIFEKPLSLINSQ